MASAQTLTFLMTLATFVACTAHVIDDVTTNYQPYEEAWAAFKLKFERNYTGEEEALRFKAFVDRVKWIEAHNVRYENSQETFTMGITQFTDYLESDGPMSCHVEEDEEEASDSADRHKRQTGFCTPFQRPTNFTPPASVDWRQKGAVTPVGDQGRCGSCYAFGVTTTIAAQVKLQTGNLTDLSEQQLVDCSKSNGCQGSTAEKSFRYINGAGGIMSESHYPYSSTTRNDGIPGPCKFDKRKAVAAVTGCSFSNSEEDLKYMVASVGPVYVSVGVTPSLQSYKVSSSVNVAVFNDPACTSSSPHILGRHCVTVVGYGSHMGTDYWIIKNSWGIKKWGKNGFGFILRGSNTCGIGDRTTVPRVSTDDSSSGAVPLKVLVPAWSPSFLSFLLLLSVSSSLPC